MKTGPVKIQRVLQPILILVVLGIFFLAGTNKETEAQDINPDDRFRQLEALHEKRMKYESQLKAMTIPQLAAQLETDSENGIEPFNSAAYQEAVSRGKSVALDLRGQLTKNDGSSFLGLLALKQVSPDDYRALDQAFRMAVLVDALKNSKTFNAWGIPHKYWEPAAQALIAEGKSLVADGKDVGPELKDLVKDNREAPVLGAPERSQLHVSDYAQALLQAIHQ